MSIVHEGSSGCPAQLRDSLSSGRHPVGKPTKINIQVTNEFKAVDSAYFLNANAWGLNRAVDSRTLHYVLRINAGRLPGFLIEPCALTDSALC